MRTEKYFFDYPLVDVNAIACAALRMIYLNSSHGAASGIALGGARQKPLDLDKEEAFKISLEHVSVRALSDEFEYNLVYLNHQMSEHIWEGRKREGSEDLRSLTRRVHFGEAASLAAKRYKTPFWVRFQRPIYIARCDDFLSNDHYVPQKYYAAFHHKFHAFVMRTELGYPLVRHLFEASGLRLSARRVISSGWRQGLRVLSYEL